MQGLELPLSCSELLMGSKECWPQVPVRSLLNWKLCEMANRYECHAHSEHYPAAVVWWALSVTALHISHTPWHAL